MKRSVLHFFLVSVILFPLLTSASGFHEQRAQAVLQRWKKEMKYAKPTDEVIVTSRYFIRDVLDRNQQFVMTNSGDYWKVIRQQYGGRYDRMKGKPIKHLYDFNWYVFNDLKKYKDESAKNSDLFFADYLKIIDILARDISEKKIIEYFFNSYYTDWLVTVTYNRIQLNKIKKSFNKGFSDLPATFQQSKPLFDSLEILLEDSEKNRSGIISLINRYNNSHFEKYEIFLTANFLPAEKYAALINAFKVIKSYDYPVKIGSDIIKLPVFELECIDNLSLTIRASGYYYDKKVYVFPENQLFSYDDFKPFFKKKDKFPLIDFFLNDTTIESFYSNNLIDENEYKELQQLSLWLQNDTTARFVRTVEELALQNDSTLSADCESLFNKSLLYHEIVGHGGTFANGVMKQNSTPSFGYHVDAEFYAFTLQYLYSPIQGFDLACMFGRMLNPHMFTHQYGDAFLLLCRNICSVIEEGEELKKKYDELDMISVDELSSNFDNFKELGFKDRVEKALYPLAFFLFYITPDEKDEIFKSVYYLNTKKPIPEVSN